MQRTSRPKQQSSLALGWRIATPFICTVISACGDASGPNANIPPGCAEFTLVVGAVQTLDPADAPCAVLNGAGKRYVITIANFTNSPTLSVGYSGRGMPAGTNSAAAKPRDPNDDIYGARPVRPPPGHLGAQIGGIDAPGNARSTRTFCLIVFPSTVIDSM
jgi:hypothetical protein